MPLPSDDRTARLQALEVGVVALQHELDRRLRAVLRGDHSVEAMAHLAFACSHQAAMLLALAAELRAGRPT